MLNVKTQIFTDMKERAKYYFGNYRRYRFYDFHRGIISRVFNHGMGAIRVCRVYDNKIAVSQYANKFDLRHINEFAAANNLQVVNGVCSAWSRIDLHIA